MLLELFATAAPYHSSSNEWYNLGYSRFLCIIHAHPINSSVYLFIACCLFYFYRNLLVFSCSPPVYRLRVVWDSSRLSCSSYHVLVCVFYMQRQIALPCWRNSDEQFLIPHQITSGINDVITCRLLFNTISHIEDGLMVFVVCAFSWSCISRHSPYNLNYPQPM